MQVLYFLKELGFCKSKIVEDNLLPYHLLTSSLALGNLRVLPSAAKNKDSGIPTRKFKSYELLSIMSFSD